MQIKHNMRSRFALILLSFTLTIFPSIMTFAASNQELKGVSSEIYRQRHSLNSQQSKYNQLQKSLRSQELGISKLKKGISQTKQKLTITNRNITILEQRIITQEQQTKAQKQQLKQLLQAYYLIQKNKVTGHIFEQNIKNDRISQYFQHLAKARTSAIENLNTTSAKLEHNKQQLNLEKSQIEKLLRTQSSKRNSLAHTQKKRQQTLGHIKKNIHHNKNYLAELRRNETRLKAEIAKAAARRNSIRMDGLAHQKGRLPWPIKGRILHNFGTRQTGEVNWKGMVIAANYGQKVKAVYSGTVVFAEYLRGYGLVVLLDHGHGDMTLYGYNQTLLKQEGQKVHAGEAIALAGDTGGQERASVYFEIRRNSRAQNPKYWLTR